MAGIKSINNRHVCVQPYVKLATTGQATVNYQALSLVLSQFQVN